MIVIPPLSIDPSTFVSSTAPELDASEGEVAWNSGTTYALGQWAATATYHIVYESLQASNLNHALPIPPITEDAWWKQIKMTNRWAMFVLMTDHGTNFNADTLIAELTSLTPLNSVAMIGLDCESYRIEVKSSGVSVYDSGVISLVEHIISDWLAYFYQPIDFKENVLVAEIPMSTSNDMKFTFVKLGGTGNIQGLFVGSSIDLGRAQYGAQSDILNFSTIDRDEFGTATFITRASKKTTKQEVWADASKLNEIIAARKRLNASTAIWAGTEDDESDFFNSLLVSGFYTEFSINLSYPEKIVSTIKIEEF